MFALNERSGLREMFEEREDEQRKRSQAEQRIRKKTEGDIGGSTLIVIEEEEEEKGRPRVATGPQVERQETKSALVLEYEDELFDEGERNPIDNILSATLHNI